MPTNDKEGCLHLDRATRKPGFPTFQGIQPALSVNPFFLKNIQLKKKKKKELFQELPGKHISLGNLISMEFLEKELLSYTEFQFIPAKLVEALTQIISIIYMP